MKKPKGKVIKAFDNKEIVVFKRKDRNYYYLYEYIGKEVNIKPMRLAQVRNTKEYIRKDIQTNQEKARKFVQYVNGKILENMV
jgi:hypothetical protein